MTIWLAETNREYAPTEAAEYLRERIKGWAGAHPRLDQWPSILAEACPKGWAVIYKAGFVYEVVTHGPGLIACTESWEDARGVLEAVKAGSYPRIKAVGK